MRSLALGLLVVLSVGCSHDSKDASPDLGHGTQPDLAADLAPSNAPPSALTYSANPAVFTHDVAITPDTPTNTGSSITSYAIAPALPAGLALDATTGILSGTPTTITAQTSYVVTGTNAYGSTTASLSITVVTAAPTDIAYPFNPVSYVHGMVIPPNTPSAGGDPVESWSVAPTLPVGLAFDTTTGTVSGTPTTATPSMQYTVTATNAGGSTSVLLAIVVVAIPPRALSYSPNPATYTKGIAITPNVPSVGGDAPTLYTVAPALPAGLSIDSTTGIISGTPTAVAAQASYVVTASNAGGMTTATLVLTVNDQPPKSVSYADTYDVYDLNHAITNDVPVVTGGTPTSYTITPALPTGITIDATTGIISGTPTAKVALGTYTITAANNVGSASTTIQLGVFDFSGQRFLELPQNTPGFDQIGSTPSSVVDYDGTNIYVGTYDGLSISSDGGSTWTTRTSFDGLPSSVVLALDLTSNSILVGTDNGLAISTDNVHFTSSLALAGKSVAAVAADDTRVYAAANSSLYVSTDGGSTFPTSYAAGNYIRAMSASPTRVCLGVTGSGAEISTDGGQTFVTRTTTEGLPNTSVYSIACPASSNLVLVGTTSGLAVSTDGGASFTNRTTSNGLCHDLIQGVYSDGTTIYAATFLGISISTDGGATFSCKSGVTARGIWASGQKVFVAADGGTLLSTNGGTSYTTVTNTISPSFPSFYALGVSGQSIDVGGVYGAWSSANGGAAFTATPSMTGWMQSVARSGTLVAWASTSGLEMSTNSGATYTLRTTADGLPANSVANVAIVGTRVYGATPSGLAVSSNSGTSFVTRTTTDGLPAVNVQDVAASGVLVVVATPSGLGLSTDNGTTFVTRTTTDGLASNACRSTVIASNGDIYVGHTNGTVSRSTDGGQSFAVMKRGLTAVSILSMSVSGKSIAVAESSNRTYLSLDGGVNFWPTTAGSGTVNRVVLDSGYLYYAATNGPSWGGVYRTQNALSAASP